MKAAIVLLLLTLLFTLLWRTGLLLLLLTQAQDCTQVTLENEQLRRGLAFASSLPRLERAGPSGSGLEGFRGSGQSNCHLKSLFTRMHRIHLLFNQEERLVSSLKWDSEDHAGLAIREEVLHYLSEHRQLSRAELEGIRFLRAEWWQDFTYGLQYLLDLQLPGAPAPPLQLRVLDDRRFQLQVFEDPNPAAQITIILALFNRGKQLQAWVRSLSQIPAEDKLNVRICVADFMSTDVQVRGLLIQAGLPFEMFSLEGTFSKTDALNHCLKWITNPDDIVFTTDVDVVLPKDVFKRIRRYTRQNLQVYAPIVLYQSCTWTTEECWADGGYGLVSYFKSDATAIGLYDNASFNFREGWEDTDFLLRLLRKPLLVVRKREREFLHLDHERSSWAELKNRGKLEEVFEPLIC